MVTDKPPETYSKGKQNQDKQTPFPSKLCDCGPSTAAVVKVWEFKTKQN